MYGAVHADRCSQLTRLIALVIARGFNLKLPSVVPFTTKRTQKWQGSDVVQDAPFRELWHCCLGRGVRFPRPPIKTTQASPQDSKSYACVFVGVSRSVCE
jgi:hypothetical protein